MEIYIETYALILNKEIHQKKELITVEETHTKRHKYLSLTYFHTYE